MAQGLIAFPGLANVNRATVSIGHGSSPSVFTVSITPQAAFPTAVGNLTLVYGTNAFVLYDCKIDSVSYSADGAKLMQVQILDRRWKWRFGAISGHYNIRNADNTIKGFEETTDRRALYNTERTPRELATLLLDAMGETGYDVGDLPNDARPTVEWEADNPAAALAELCEQLGCRITLRMNRGNSVAIRRLNVGGVLPTTVTPHRVDEAVDPPEMPDALRMVCGPSLFQVDLRLLAVGEDTDGSIKRINDLSYKPVAGWSIADLPDFNSIPDTKIRELAKRSVFRMFQPLGSNVVPGYGTIERLEQILPLTSSQVDTTVTNNVAVPKRAVVFGVWAMEGGDSENSVASLVPLPDDEDASVLPSWSLDEERGIVLTNEYVYKLSGTVPNLTIAEPELVLRTAVTVREPATMAFVRHERELANNGTRLGTRPRYIRIDDVRLTHRCDYLPAGNGAFLPGAVEQNLADVNAECDYYLNAEAATYGTIAAKTIVYSGLFGVELDGLIQRVTWNVGAPFASTTVELGRDPGNSFAIPYRVARGLEKMKEVQGAMKNLTLRRLRDRLQRSRGQ